MVHVAAGRSQEQLQDNQPPKELPSEGRRFWRRVRSVLEGGPVVGEPRLTGGVSCRGVRGTDLPLSPGDTWRCRVVEAYGRMRTAVGAMMLPAPRGAPADIPRPWPAGPWRCPCAHGTALRRRRAPV